MKYSLWRVDERLGDIEPDGTPAPPGFVHGTIMSSPTFAEQGTLMQTRPPERQDAAIVHTRFIDPVDSTAGETVTETILPDGTKMTCVSVPLVEQRGTTSTPTPGDLLTVRDADHRVIDTDWVLLDQRASPPWTPAPGPGELRRWMIAFCEAGFMPRPSSLEVL